MRNPALQEEWTTNSKTTIGGNNDSKENKVKAHLEAMLQDHEIGHTLIWLEDAFANLQPIATPITCYLTTIKGTVSPYKRIFSNGRRMGIPIIYIQSSTWAMWFCDIAITPLARAWPAGRVSPAPAIGRVLWR